MRLVLAFKVGLHALTGDLEQFYNSCKLIPSQWNLQKFLYRQELNPAAPVQIGVIKTLIYGVASVSAQSENAMQKLGDLIKDDKPHVKKLINDAYVDDVAQSMPTREDCIKLADDSTEVFSMVGLKCKAYTISGEDPDPKVTKDGVSIGVAGARWFSKLDVMEIKIPKLHFGKKRKGRQSFLKVALWLT